MDCSDIRSRLQYVTELLEDLRHFHHNNTHACKCDVCINKTSLLKSSIAKAAEEVCMVMLSLDCGNLKDLSNEVSTSSILNVSSQRLLASSTDVENVIADIKKDGLKMDKNLATRHSTRPTLTDQSTSLFCSTQRDSGLHTLLNSQSISPILNSDDCTTEESIRPHLDAQTKSSHVLNLTNVKLSEPQEVFKSNRPCISPSNKISSNAITLPATPPVNVDMLAHMTPTQPTAFFPTTPVFHPQPTPMPHFPYGWPNPTLNVPITTHPPWASNMFMPFSFIPYLPSPHLLQDIETCRRLSENIYRTPELFSAGSEYPEDKRNQTFSYFPYTPPSSHCKATDSFSNNFTPLSVLQTKSTRNVNQTKDNNFVNTTSSMEVTKSSSVELSASKKRSPEIFFETCKHESHPSIDPSGMIHSKLGDKDTVNEPQKLEKSLMAIKLDEANDIISLALENSAVNTSLKIFTDPHYNLESSAVQLNQSALTISEKVQLAADSSGAKPDIRCQAIKEIGDAIQPDMDDSMWRPWETKFNILQLIASDHNDSVNSDCLEDSFEAVTNNEPDMPVPVSQQNGIKNIESNPMLKEVDDNFCMNQSSSCVKKNTYHAEMKTKPSSSERSSSVEVDKKVVNEKSENTKSKHKLSGRVPLEEKINNKNKYIKEIPLSDKSSISNLNNSLPEKLISSLISITDSLSNKENCLSPQKSTSSSNINHNTNNTSTAQQTKSPKKYRFGDLSHNITVSCRTADDPLFSGEVLCRTVDDPLFSDEVSVKNSKLKVSKDSPPVSYKKIEWGAPAILNQDSLIKREQILTKSMDAIDSNNEKSLSKITISSQEYCQAEVGDKISEDITTLTDMQDEKLNTCKKPYLKLNQSLPAHCYVLHSKRSFLATSPINESYEVNQSFPKITKSVVSVTSCALQGEQDVKNLHQIVTPHLETKPRNRRSIFGLSPPDLQQNRWTKDKHLESESDSSLCGLKQMSDSVEGIWKYLDATDEIGLVPSIKEIIFNCVTSSICVVNTSRGGKIVSLNESFQFLIGVHEKVFGQRLFRFIKVKDSLNKIGQSIPHTFVLSDGSLTQVSGKLLSCIDARGLEIPVTVWTVPFSTQPHLTVCVVEITNSISADIYLGHSGDTLLTCTVQDFLGYDTSEEGIVNKMINVSDLDVLKSNIQQYTTIQAFHGVTMPATIVMTNQLDESPIKNPETDELMYPAQLIIALHKAGVMIVDADGYIQSFDQNFFQVHFGFNKTNSISQQNLCDLLSDVVKISDTVYGGSDSSPKHEGSFIGKMLIDVSNLQSAEDDITDVNICLPNSCFLNQDDEELSCDEEGVSIFPDNLDKDENKEKCSIFPPVMPCQTSTPCKPLHSLEKEKKIIEKTHHPSSVSMDNGIYYSLFLHKSGTKVPVTFKLSRFKTPGKPSQFCLWFCLQSANVISAEDEYSEEDEDSSSFNENEEGDSQDDVEETESISEHERLVMHFKHLRLDAVDTRVPDVSLGQVIAEQAVLNQSYNASMNHSHFAATDEDRLDLEAATAGKFSSRFTVGEALGQGSFGFVRRAKDIHTNSSFVVKFIKKSKLFEDSWTHNDVFKKVPLEVAILSTISYDYIIKLVDVYENNFFIQMVMEDFGEIDLFDFIDQVAIDEPMASHLFQQIVKAVNYLHCHGIVHRDIKDENVVVNSSFHCKLIDFGSASYMLPRGVKFTIFRGTLEYCSPEVHRGEGYFGPELDIWALGVTLFTIVFRENPFTVESGPYELTESDLPYTISDELVSLLFGLLKVNPVKRYNMEQIVNSDWLKQQTIDLSSYSWEEMFGVKFDEVDVVNTSC